MAILRAWVFSALEAPRLEEVLKILRGCGYVAEARDPGTFSIERFLSERAPDLLLTDGVISGQSATQWANQLGKAVPGFEDKTAWGVILASQPVELLTRLASAGILGVFSPDRPAAEWMDGIRAMEARRKDPIREIGDLVMLVTGVQLDASKNILIEKRLTKRMLELGIRDVQDYIRYFRRDRVREIPNLVSQMTTHTTQFFRDTSHFDYLVDVQLDELMQQGRPLRFWSAACSTGQEVYSIAIALLEGARTRGLREPKFEILGTDIDPAAVAEAQRGIYPADQIEGLSPVLVARYFDKGSGEISNLYRVKSWVWERCQFRIQNLLSETYPEGSFDGIFARNVFIYFKKEEVSRIASRMRETLTPTGRLYIGFSETLDPAATGMSAVGKAIYGRSRGGGTLAHSSTSVSRPRVAPPVTGGAPAATPSSGFTKVLVVDDSKTVRAVLKSILSPDQGFVVIGEAENPIHAMEFLKTHSVDVMTLDIHMPVMDGVEYLSRIQGNQHPPVVMISSVNREEALQVMKCLELGASDYIEKPKGNALQEDAEKIRSVLRGVVESASKRKSLQGKRKDSKGSAEVSTPLALAPPIVYESNSSYLDLVVIGASTGGIEAIRTLMPRFPKNSPPIVIVQHIPPLFSELFANRLNEVSQVKVQETREGTEFLPGNAYIARGGVHLGLEVAGGHLYAKEITAPHLHGCRPAVDYFWRSVAGWMNRTPLRVSAAILTGMGKDGAEGLLELKERGAHTIAQDEDTCIVYGMPKAAFDLGGVKQSLPLNSIPHHLMEFFGKPQSERRKRVA